MTRERAGSTNIGTMNVVRVHIASPTIPVSYPLLLAASAQLYNMSEIMTHHLISRICIYEINFSESYLQQHRVI